MPNAKPTPGPWEWVNPESDESRCKGEMRSSLRTVEHWPCFFAMGRQLPKWILDAEITDSDEMEANARLIAAAPLMLEALEEIVGNACKNFEGSMDIYPEAIDVARAAIRAAKGESDAG